MKEKLRFFFVNPIHSRTLTVLIMLIIVAAIPLTVYISQKPQELRQRASARDWQFPRDFSGIQGQNNLTYFGYHKTNNQYLTARWNDWGDGRGPGWRWDDTNDTTKQPWYNGVDVNFNMQSGGLFPSWGVDNVVRWTSPEAGTITLTGSFQRSSNTAGTAHPDENPKTIYTVKKNSTSLFTQNANDNTSYPFVQTIPVATGDTIEFWVDANTDSGFDTTTLNFSIQYQESPTQTPTPTPTISTDFPNQHQKGWHYGASNILFEWQYHWVRNSNGNWAIFSVGQTSLGSAMLVTAGTPSGRKISNMYLGTLTAAPNGFDVTFNGNGASYRGTEEQNGERIVISTPYFDFNGLFSSDGRVFQVGDTQITQSIISPDYYSRPLIVNGSMTIEGQAIPLTNAPAENDHQYGRLSSGGSINDISLVPRISAFNSSQNVPSNQSFSHDWIYAKLGTLTVTAANIKNSTTTISNYMLLQKENEAVQRATDVIFTPLEAYSYPNLHFSKKIQISSNQLGINLIINIPFSNSLIVGSVLQEDGSAEATATYQNQTYSGFAIKESTDRDFVLPTPNQTATPTGTPDSANLARNGGFEEDTLYTGSGVPTTGNFSWYPWDGAIPISRSQDKKRSGTWSLKGRSSPTQTITVEPNTTYEMSSWVLSDAWAFTDIGDNRFSAVLNGNHDGDCEAYTSSPSEQEQINGDTWLKLTCRFTTTPTASQLQIRLIGYTNSTWWDDVAFRQIPSSSPTPVPTATPVPPTSTPIPPAATLTPTASPFVANPDVNRDGCVGRADYNAWRTTYLNPNVIPSYNGHPTHPDINGDNAVDLIDYNYWYNAMLSGTNVCSGG